MSIFKFKIKSKITITGEKIFDIWNITPFHDKSGEVISIDYKEYFTNNESKLYVEVGYKDNRLSEYAWVWNISGGGYWAFRMSLRR